MDRRIGQELGNYRILEKIGRGGMATVYKAYQPSLDRYVAIKILPAHLNGEPGFARRFQREARAVAKLEHPHILPVHDFGQEGELSYIVMRYVEGGTLKERMGDPMELNQIAKLIDQIGEALDHAHNEGIVHRDVKPSNVLLDKDDWVLLTDFGVARMVEGVGRLTASGVGVGTPTYMSPEQGRGERVDRRSDVYSLGILLYEMLTGRVPYEAETPVAVVWKHVHDPLPLPRSINPAIPEAVERVVLKALSKAPENRYRLAGEMAVALQKAVQAVGAEEAIPELVGEDLTRDELIVTPSMERKPRKVMNLLWIVPVVFLAVAVIGWPIWREILCERFNLWCQPPPIVEVAEDEEVERSVEEVSEPQVAFVSDRDGNFEIYGMDVDGSNQVNLTNHSADDLEPTWSPDGSKIAFVSERDGNKEIYIMDAAGTNPLRLTNDPATDKSPAWSPDGKHIAFTSYRSGNYEIYVIDEAGSKLSRITNHGAIQFSWSPDGKRIAFVGDFRGDLYSVSPDGSDLVRLTHGRTIYAPPVWSPEGDRIAFVTHHKYYTGRVHIIYSNGSGEKEVPFTHGGNYLDWSPDGRRLIVNGPFYTKMYVLDVESGEFSIINEHSASRIYWLPDGKTIGFQGHVEVNTVNVEDRITHNLTNNLAIDKDPEWWWPAEMYESRDDPTIEAIGEDISSVQSSKPVPTSTVSATAASNPDATASFFNVLFKDDFEGGIATGIREGGGEWAVVDDGTGNHVLEANSLGETWSYYHFTSSFSDGAIEFRFQLIDLNTEQNEYSGHVFLQFRDIGWPRGGYLFAIHGFFWGGAIYFQGEESNDNWVELEGTKRSFRHVFQEGVWYSVRVEAQGKKMKAFINGSLVASVEDSRLEEGRVFLGVGPEMIAQFDDIKILY